MDPLKPERRKRRRARFRGTLNAPSVDRPDAADFVTRTGVDALAVAVGTSHGAYKLAASRQVIFSMDVVRSIHRRLPHTHLVMHGASGPEDIREVINRHGEKISKRLVFLWKTLSKGLPMGL